MNATTKNGTQRHQNYFDWHFNIVDSAEKLIKKLLPLQQCEQNTQKNTSQTTLSAIQKSMEGEAKKAGFKSEEDVTLYIKALRKSSNY